MFYKLASSRSSSRKLRRKPRRRTSTQGVVGYHCPPVEDSFEQPSARVWLGLADGWLGLASGARRCLGQCLKPTTRRCSSFSRRRWRRSGRPRRPRWSPSSSAQASHGLADPPDPQAGGLGFNHRRVVLRPRPEYVRQRAPSLHLALFAMLPLHAVHGEFPDLSFFSSAFFF